MYRFGLAILMTTLAVPPAVAHDFWLQPRRFTLAQPATVPVLIYVGHGAARSRWGVGPDRVVLFRSIGPDGVIDRVPALTLDGPSDDAFVPLSKPGGYMLAFQSRDTASDLPYLRFNDYIAVEGLTLVQAARKRTRTERSEGHEMYSRRAKAIIQVGPVDAAAIARIIKPVGLSLEIVPERHPLALKPNEALPLRILFNGKPLPGALVKLNNLGADEKPLAVQRSAADGRVRFAVPRKGAWQVNVVWSVPTNGKGEADFQTTFSSLTFGY